MYSFILLIAISNIRLLDSVKIVKFLVFNGDREIPKAVNVEAS